MQSDSNRVKNKIKTSNQTEMHLDNGKRLYDTAFQALDAELEQFLRSKSTKKSRKSNDNTAKEITISGKNVKQGRRTKSSERINKEEGIKRKVLSATKTYEGEPRKLIKQCPMDNFAHRSQISHNSPSISNSNCELKKTQANPKRLGTTKYSLDYTNSDTKNISSYSKKTNPKEEKHRERCSFTKDTREMTVQDEKALNLSKGEIPQRKNDEDHNIPATNTSFNYATKENSSTKIQVKYHTKFVDERHQVNIANPKAIHYYAGIDNSVAMFAKSIASATRGARIYHRNSVHCQRKDFKSGSMETSKLGMQCIQAKSPRDDRSNLYERKSNSNKQKKSSNRNSTNEPFRWEDDNSKNKFTKNAVSIPALSKEVLALTTKDRKSNNLTQSTEEKTVDTLVPRPSRKLNIQQNTVVAEIKAEYGTVDSLTRDEKSATPSQIQTKSSLNEDSATQARRLSSSEESSEESDSSSSDSESSSTDSDLKTSQPKVKSDHPVINAQSISRINRTHFNSTIIHEKGSISDAKSEELPESLLVGRVEYIANVPALLRKDSKSEGHKDSDIKIEQGIPPEQKHSQMITVQIQTPLISRKIEDGIDNSIFKNGCPAITTSFQASSLIFPQNEDLSEISDTPLDSDGKHLEADEDKLNQLVQETKSVTFDHHTSHSNVDCKNQSNISECPTLDVAHQFLVSHKIHDNITEAVDIEEDFEEQVVPDQSSPVTCSVLDNGVDSAKPINFEVSSEAFQEMFAEFLYTPEGLSPIPESILSDELGPVTIEDDDVFSGFVDSRQDFTMETSRNDNNPPGLDVNQPHWNIPSKQRLGYDPRMRHVINGSPRAHSPAKSSKSSTNKSGSLKLRFKRCHKDEWSVISSEDAACEARSQEFEDSVDLSTVDPCRFDASTNKVVKVIERTKLPLDCRSACKIGVINRVYMKRALKNNGLIKLKT